VSLAPADGRIGNVAGAVLMGGASSRMGRDKAHLPIGGVAGATRAARLLGSLFEEVLLVGGDPPDDTPGRRVRDGDGPACALRGLAAALGAAAAPRVLVVATDLPLLTPDLLLALVAWPEADAVVPRTSHGPQPLCALYARDAVLPAARRRLLAGELALHGLLAAVQTSYLEPADLARLDPQGTALFNLNTPQDLEELKSR
jgi:molybdopterin-guanine dinucleotide biosynthesis protein A